MVTGTLYIRCACCHRPFSPWKKRETLCPTCLANAVRNQSFDNWKWAVINLLVKAEPIPPGTGRLTHVEAARLFKNNSADLYGEYSAGKPPIDVAEGFRGMMVP